MPGNSLPLCSRDMSCPILTIFDQILMDCAFCFRFVKQILLTSLKIINFYLYHRNHVQSTIKRHAWVVQSNQIVDDEKNRDSITAHLKVSLSQKSVFTLHTTFFSFSLCSYSTVRVHVFRNDFADSFTCWHQLFVRKSALFARSRHNIYVVKFHCKAFHIVRHSKLNARSKNVPDRWID